MADLSVREVAKRVRTSDRTVRRWIAERKLAATKNADGWTVDESDLTAFLDGRTSTANHVDGRIGARPSEAPLLVELLAATQAELVRTAAAAAMWQARAEHLQGQVEQLQKALPAPDTSPDHATTATHPSPPRLPWWALWRRVRA